MVDELENFQECSFRGIPFPVSSVGENIQQQLVQHKRIDRDGAFVEATGRNPIVFTLVIPFFNTISRGATETWDNLYPFTFLSLRAAVKDDRSAGIFVHPLYGQILCKPQTWEAPLQAQQRGGQIVTLTLIETVESSSAEVGTTKVKNSAKNFAVDLDNFLAELDPPVSFFSQGEGEDFTAVVDKITAVADSTTLQSERIMSLIGSTIRKTEQVVKLVNRATSVAETNPDGTRTVVGTLNAGKSRIEQSAIGLRDELYAIRKSILNDSNQFQGVYVTEKPLMMVGLSQILNNTPDELRTLNPTLPSVRIPEKTIIRYYTK